MLTGLSRTGVETFPDFAGPAKRLQTPGVPMRQIVRVSVGLLLLAVLVGCGKRSRYGTVSGKVTYKGQPVNDAALVLYPTAGGTVKNAFTIPVTQEGTFRIADVPPGEYKVVVQGAGKGDDEAALLRDLPRDKKEKVKSMMEGQRTPVTIPFPDKYKNPNTTDLRCTITDKDQKLDLELKD